MFMASIKTYTLFNDNMDKLKRIRIEPKDMASWANKYVTEKAESFSIELRWFLDNLIKYYLDSNEKKNLLF